MLILSIIIQENANSGQAAENDESVSKSENSQSLSEINLSVSDVCVFLVDDSNDIDIPLLDIHLNNLIMNKKLLINTSTSLQRQGSAQFVLNVDYFNRLLSGWEPLIEPWRPRIDWKVKSNKNIFTVTSMDVLNVNVTNTLVQLANDVMENWRADFSARRLPKQQKVFQPYKLVNLTGQKINFIPYQYTDSSDLLTSSDLVGVQDLGQTEIGTEWIPVEDKCEKRFNFLSANSERHKDCKLDRYYQRMNKGLQKLIQNRMRIKIDGWSEIRPLTVDKVGTYYREIYSETNENSPVRSITCLIFEISLNRNATKTIEIKSSVLIKNRLNYKVQCRIESLIPSKAANLGPLIVEIDLDAEAPVPIKYLPCQVWFRPTELDAEFSESSLDLEQLEEVSQIEYYPFKCRLASSFWSSSSSSNSSIQEAVFYFFAKIKHHLFQTKKKKPTYISGFNINIEHAFTLYNLLPIEFGYRFCFNERRQSNT